MDYKLSFSFFQYIYLKSINQSSFLKKRFTTNKQEKKVFFFRTIYIQTLTDKKSLLNSQDTHNIYSSFSLNDEDIKLNLIRVNIHTHTHTQEFVPETK